ncbi:MULTISPECIES: type II toxin-antitoxin system PrlF family antitoxin [unclassified Lactobacillus]|uniref:type II toxin-antitoxin system PrlF family antitoxin n=1 Tax=unclassified Lactobacillus TaxID=2620435 RepID=UPI000EFA5BF0|nr:MULTISPECIES: type II toxin-antitoxin system PrlF family antitoxin [unclassified Lactobacillus]RMC38108.1 AbrB family transcriptional regulator [Lactobacillus sp. ESL0237]RMC42639.1 AbrB family transcriptional regulator [Lactobacillus sp. ESL0234]RMC43336.1 AbrB family transcriptional regulator [Lactobacillus sp. ESL0236]RMC47851.1 AbrB family transcriptional regulator [Lactobacillus sp. ESL0225]
MEPFYKKNTVTSTLTAKNQITIPKIIRKFLDIKPTDMISWDIRENNTVVVSSIKKNIWDVITEQATEYGNIDVSEFDWCDDEKKGI